MDLMFDREQLKKLYTASNQEKRIQRIESLLKREIQLSLEDNVSHKYIKQKDKDETLLTLYTMFALDINPLYSWQELMKKAFCKEDWSDFIKPIIKLEKPIPPTKVILKSLKGLASENPVKYLRDESEIKDVVEGNTVFDCVLTQDKKMMFIECKFTSDISYQTTYVTIRNQLARCIDVGLAEINYDVNNFYFLLVTSAIYKKNPGSRFYYYKMNEYQNDIKVLAQDIKSIKDHYKEEELDKKLEILSSHIGWVTWEDCYEIIQNSNIDKGKLQKLTEFYKERLLVK